MHLKNCHLLSTDIYLRLSHFFFIVVGLRCKYTCKANYGNYIKQKRQFWYTQVQVWGMLVPGPLPTFLTPFTVTEHVHNMSQNLPYDIIYMRYQYNGSILCNTLFHRLSKQYILTYTTSYNVKKYSQINQMWTHGLIDLICIGLQKSTLTILN